MFVPGQSWDQRHTNLKFTKLSFKTLSASKKYKILKIGWMLKAPPLNSLGLHILVFQDRFERGAYNMFKNPFEKVKKNIFPISGQTMGL